MERALLRAALTICVMALWIVALPRIAPSIIGWWQSMSPNGRWSLVIIVLAALLTRATVRRVFRVAKTLDYERVARAVSMPTPAHVSGAIGGVSGEASDRANYSPQVWQRICRHEAAHIITLVAQGGTLQSVRLKRDGAAAAGVSGGFDTQLTVQDRAWKHLVWSLAGYVVDDTEDIHDEGSTGDIASAFQNVATILSTGRHPEGYQDELTMDQLITGAREQATRLLQEHHAALEALQTELMHAERGVLRARDLPSLAPVIGHSGNPWRPSPDRLTAAAARTALGR